MTDLDLVVVVIFSLIVLVAGLSFAKLGGSSGSSSFFSGGGVVPWWVSGLSLYMSFFSVGTFVVWGSIAYSDGLVAVSIQTMMCIAGFIIAFFIAPRWNRTNVLTAAEFIGDRLGAGTKTTFTTLFLLTQMVGLGGFLYPVGRIVEISTGVPFETAILFLSAFILIYTVVGGLWAVLVTDVLQFVVLFAAIIIVVPLALLEVGGLRGFIDSAPENFFALSNSEYTPTFLMAFLIYNTVFIGGHWAYVQRYTSVATAGAARKVALVFGVLYSVSPLIWMMPPMIYRVMQPDLPGLDDEGAYMLISQQVMPSGLLGLMLAAMVFATASSVNTILNISAAVFTNDVFNALQPDASERRLVWVARASTAVFGLAAVASAFLVLQLGGIVSMVLTVAAVAGGSLFMPPIWAMFSRRQTAVSVLTATLLSLTVNIIFNFVTPALFEMELSRAGQMLLGVACPALVLALFECVYLLQGREDRRMPEYRRRQEAREQVKRNSIAQSVDDHVAERSNGIISVSISVVGALIIALGFLSPGAQAVVVVTGLTIFGGGLLVNRSIQARLLGRFAKT